jgi:hypothetical protein
MIDRLSTILAGSLKLIENSHKQPIRYNSKSSWRSVLSGTSPDCWYGENTWNIARVQGVVRARALGFAKFRKEMRSLTRELCRGENKVIDSSGEDA